MTTEEKIKAIDALVAKEGMFIYEACREYGLTSRRYDMIKRETRKQKALEFLLSQVPAEAREQYLDMIKYCKKDYKRRTKILIEKSEKMKYNNGVE